MKLRVVTYNIHKGVMTFGQRPKIHMLKRALRSLKADLIFLQEVRGRDERLAERIDNPLLQKAQHEFLAGRVYNSVYGMNRVYDYGHHGNALLTRFRILHSENRDVSDNTLESRGILHCVVETEYGLLYCYVLHLGLLGKSRKYQTNELVNFVRETAPPSAMLLIAGDTNDWENQIGDTLREKLNVCEVFDDLRMQDGLLNNLRRMAGLKPKISPALTFPSSLPILRLDRIYVRGLSVESAKVLQGERWGELSDHAPVISVLNIPTPPQVRVV